MNRDDIIRMAREAGAKDYGTGEEGVTTLMLRDDAIERFFHMAQAAERERLLPKDPPFGLLMSMAVRYDHGLGMPGYYDHGAFKRFNGDSHAKRLEGVLSIMRQLYEEVSRQGFYSDDREDEYSAMRARGEV